MTILRRVLERRFESWPWPDPPAGAPLMPSWATGPMMNAGINVSDDAALTHSAVFGCVRLVSETMLALPIDAYRKLGNIRQPVDPLPPLLAQPHPDMSMGEWISRMTASLLMQGNAYGKVIAVDRLGYPTAVLPIHPAQVTMRRDRATGALSYKFGGDAETGPWPSGAALHIRGFTLAGSDQGLGPVTYARQAIGLGLAAERWGASLFSNSASPSGVLVVPQPLNEPEAEAIKDRWEKAHGGGTRRPAVLSGGAQWQQVSLSPEDSQFLQTRAWQLEDVCRWFGVPPILIGEHDKQSSWASSIEAIGLLFLTYGLAPWIVRLEQALSNLIPRGQYARVNTGGLLRTNLDARYQAYSIARQWGWITVNEIRALEGMPPVPGGDTLLTPLNMGALGGPGVPTKDEPTGGPSEGPDVPDQPRSALDFLLTQTFRGT